MLHVSHVLHVYTVTPLCATTQRCGAGVYVGPTDQGYTVCPNGNGITNTINRAELAGILAALSTIIPPTEDATILSDSLCSLFQIHKMLRTPMAIKTHLHSPMLRDIAQAIQARAALGTHTHLGKVPAHTGITGNEKADAIANTAAAIGVTHDIDIPTDNTPFPSLYWPGAKPPGSDTCTYFANMHKALTPSLPKKCPAAPRGIYCRSWEQVQPHIDPRYAAYIHTSAIPMHQRLNAMKYRDGCLWNVKIANRMKIPYTATIHAPPTQPDACPLCGCSDSGGHMLGECTHPHIKGLIIQRHNIATQHIAQIIRQSPPPDHPGIPVDGRRQGRLPASTGRKSRPSVLAPPSPGRHTTTSVPTRHSVYIFGWNGELWHNDTVPTELKANTTIYLLEIGYGPDTRYVSKRAEKLTQHNALMQLLRDEGWKVADPSIFIFGVGGSIYKSTRDILTSTFQLPNSVIDNLVHKLQRHALEKAQQIVATRRFLERSTQRITPPHLMQRATGHRASAEMPTAVMTGRSATPDTVDRRVVRHARGAACPPHPTGANQKNRGHRDSNRGRAPSQPDSLRVRVTSIRKRTGKQGLAGGGK